MERRRGFRVSELGGGVRDRRAPFQELRRERVAEVVEPEVRELRGFEHALEDAGGVVEVERRAGLRGEHPGR